MIFLAVLKRTLYSILFYSEAFSYSVSRECRFRPNDVDFGVLGCVIGTISLCSLLLLAHLRPLFLSIHLDSFPTSGIRARLH